MYFLESIDAFEEIHGFNRLKKVKDESEEEKVNTNKGETSKKRCRSKRGKEKVNARKEKVKFDEEIKKSIEELIINR